MGSEMVRVDLEAEGLLTKATPIEEQCPRCPQVFLVQLSFMSTNEMEGAPSGLPASTATHMTICPGRRAAGLGEEHGDGGDVDVQATRERQAESADRVNARAAQLALDPTWALDLDDPATRWALLRAGGWAGDVGTLQANAAGQVEHVGDVVGWYESEDPETGVKSMRPIIRYIENRNRSLECRHGIRACYRMGCPTSGRCEGALAAGDVQPDVAQLAHHAGTAARMKAGW